MTAISEPLGDLGDQIAIKSCIEKGSLRVRGKTSQISKERASRLIDLKWAIASELDDKGARVIVPSGIAVCLFGYTDEDPN